jgi:hypothetical protein
MPSLDQPEPLCSTVRAIKGANPIVNLQKFKMEGDLRCSTPYRSRNLAAVSPVILSFGNFERTKSGGGF